MDGDHTILVIKHAVNKTSRHILLNNILIWVSFLALCIWLGHLASFCLYYQLN